MSAFRLNRRIDKSVQPWMGSDEVYEADTVVYRYSGCTYGCIGPAGVAVTLKPGITPFFEVPADSLVPLEG